MILTSAHVLLDNFLAPADLRYQRCQGQEGRSWKYVCEDVCIAERKTHQVGREKDFPKGAQEIPKESHGYMDYMAHYIAKIYPMIQFCITCI